LGFVLERLESRIAPITHGFAVIGVVGFILVALVTIVDVLMRWLLNSPIDGVEEVSVLMIGVSTVTFFPIVNIERGNINITFLGALFGPSGRAWLCAFGAMITSAFFIVIVWQFVLYTLQLHSAGETTWILAWPITPWWIVTTAFIAVAAPVQVIVFLVELKRAVEGGGPAEPEVPEPVREGDSEY
jgi:TRAP-type C4-dicarboxylate transport system permease small subunit